MRVLALIVVISVFTAATPLNAQESPEPDVVIVGAGISGLSAALESARGGLTVTVVDMWSIFGGHAVMSTGGLSINGTEYQRERDIVDSPDLHEQDFFTWGEDPDPGWVEYYTSNSSTEIADWLQALGVEWEAVFQPPGNSVPRFHLTKGRGVGLVTPIYREVLRYPNVTFRWNFEITELVVEQNRVVGVRGEDLRTGARDEIRASHVLLATGGFQSNLDLVQRFWPGELEEPTSLLVGSGLNSVGSGLSLAEQAGAALHRMDQQWNYPWGLPHPSYPGEGRALSANNWASIWVNAQGERFVNEQQSPRFTLPALVAQRPSTYWAIFDEDGKDSFFISGSGWSDPARVEAEVLNNAELTTVASSIADLADAIAMDGAVLNATVQRFNALVERGVDEDFGRFNSENELPSEAKIESAPFYAVQLFPMTRKSMGGIAVDRATRVIRDDGSVIAGLYASGETTGFAGVNGSAGLEGTFLGPALLTGRVAGQTIVDAVAESRVLTSPEPIPYPTVSERPEAGEVDATDCETCHSLPQLLTEREGYAHFERVHRIVLDEQRNCTTCHAEMVPFNASSHRIDRFAQTQNCLQCHLADESTLVFQ